MFFKEILLYIAVVLLSTASLLCGEIRFSDFVSKTQKAAGVNIKNDNTLLLNISTDRLREAVLFRKSLTVNGFQMDGRDHYFTMERKQPVADNNSTIITTGPDGDVPLPVPEIISFSGTVDGQAGSYVSMVFIDSELYISIDDNGSNYSLKPVKNSNSEEASDYLLSPASFDEFTCYNQETREVYEKIEKAGKDFVQSNDLLECELALETDTEFFEVCGSNIVRAEKYALLLMQMVSNLYEKEVKIVFYVAWLKCWSNSPADPYQIEGDPNKLAEKAIPYWAKYYTKIPRDLAHVITSSSKGGGGLGYLNALCNRAGDYSMSFSSVQGGHKYPTTDFTYDMYIVAHELGHNFNAQHTHSCFWNPPIDTCVVEEGIAGGCLKTGQKPLPNPGTIMSYCGSINYETYGRYEVQMIFDSQNKALIRKTAENASCLSIKIHKNLVLTHSVCNRALFSGDTIIFNWVSWQISNINFYYTTNGGKNWILIEKKRSTFLPDLAFTIPDLCGQSICFMAECAEDTSVKSMTESMSVTKPSQDGLIARYDFDDKNILDMQECGSFDLKPFCTLTGAPDRYNQPDKAIKINRGGYLTANPFISSPEQFTVSLWFYPENNSTIQYILCQDREQGSFFGLWLWFGNLGGMVPTVNGEKQLWAGEIKLNRWYHCVLTYDGRSLALYLNGVLSVSADNVYNLKNACSPLYVCSRYQKETFDGAVDDIMIYTRCLNSNEVTMLYNSQAGAAEGPDSEYEPIELFPVPSADVLNIRVNTPVVAGGTFTIYMPDGRQAFPPSALPAERLHVMDVSSLAPGVYYYTYNAGADTFTGKFAICR